MNMPGFTAEASLSKSNEQYVFTADKAQYLRRREVIPQVVIVIGGCLYECDVLTRRCRLTGCYA
jgi:hypothetical protein